MAAVIGESLCASRCEPWRAERQLRDRGRAVWPGQDPHSLIGLGTRPRWGPVAPRHDSRAPLLRHSHRRDNRDTHPGMGVGERTAVRARRGVRPMAVVRVEVGDLTRRPRRRDEREKPPKTTSGGTRSPYAFGITSADGAHPARPTLVEFSEPPHTSIHTPKGPDEARTRRTSAGPSGPADGSPRREGYQVSARRRLQVGRSPWPT